MSLLIIFKGEVANMEFGLFEQMANVFGLFDQHDKQEIEKEHKTATKKERKEKLWSKIKVNYYAIIFLMITKSIYKYDSPTLELVRVDDDKSDSTHESSPTVANEDATTKIMNEILETEESYCNDLETLIKVIQILLVTPNGTTHNVYIIDKKFYLIMIIDVYGTIG